MTLLVFPTFPGIDIALSKRSEVKSEIYTNPYSGKETRLRFQHYPKYIFKLSVNVLFDNADEQEMQDFLGFVAAVGGQASPFLFIDPTDCQAVGQVIAVGTGDTANYQLQRKVGGFSEPVNQPVIGTVQLFVDGAPATASVSDTGAVVLWESLPVGAVLTWSGQYYYRVRFTEDGFDIVRLSVGLYDCQDIEFIGSVREAV